MKPALVILAAGASTRLGQCKALVSLGGRTVLERLLSAGAGLDDLPPLVVGGADHEALRAALPCGVELAQNPAWSEGRTGSLALAVGLRPGRDLMVAPVDVPLVPEAVFQALTEAWERAGAPPRGWLAPALRSPQGPPRPGHPVLLGRDLATRLPGMGRDEPLRNLRQGADPAWLETVSSPEILDDLDTPSDLAKLRSRMTPA